MRILYSLTLLVIIIASVAAQADKTKEPDKKTEEKKPEPPKPKPKPLGPDPCEKKKCSIGEDCRRKEGAPDVAECYCIESCSDREFPDPLCTNKNVTFNTICEFERQVCMCKSKKTPCKPPGPGEYIVYYSECQGEFCNKDYDMIDYANRLAQWLRDAHAARTMMPSDLEVNKNDIINPLGTKDHRVSSAMYNSPDGNAVYVSWWFCDLDKDNDGNLDRTEISPITRALMPNEQCIQTFLSKCDKNSDSKISNDEWHADECFKVKKGKKSCVDIFKLSSYI